MLIFMVVMSLSLLFFFFKQKTAYELRIRDWSSDVCSSDLVSAALPGGDHTIIVGDVVACDHEVDSEPLVYFSRQFSTVCSPSLHARHAYDWQLEIGRASCRERVCQYV